MLLELVAELEAEDVGAVVLQIVAKPDRGGDPCHERVQLVCPPITPREPLKDIVEGYAYGQ